MTANDDNPADLDRYSRQYRYPAVGVEGQRRLGSGRALVCGCGALGSVIANGLVRAGVGFVRIVDRDFVELNNLQRQILFDEADVTSGLPKAEAASRKLQQINSNVTVEPIVAHVDHRNIHALADDVDVILDGTDNFETRFLINDYCHEVRKPWVYGGCIGSEGQTMTILPGHTPCLRCLVETIPPPGSTPTCETAGILSPASAIIANLQIAEALKLLAGRPEAVNRDLVVIDIWENRLTRLKLAGLQEQGNCPTCKQGLRTWLEGTEETRSTTLCGRNAVQISPARRLALDWDQLRRQLPDATELVANAYLLRFQLDGFEFTVFADGRAIIKGTSDPVVARTLYARYLGN